MRIVVRTVFVSRKTAIAWPGAGMRKGADADWLAALRTEVEPFRESLVRNFKGDARLKMVVRIHGPSERIGPLDIHDALAQIVDQFTDILFPRQRGRPIPQTADRYFWSVRAEKIVDDDHRVELEIGKL